MVGICKQIYEKSFSSHPGEKSFNNWNVTFDFLKYHDKQKPSLH